MRKTIIDSFKGWVKTVIDGETIDLEVSQSGIFKRYIYKDIEQIHIFHLYTKELIIPREKLSKPMLEHMLMGKEVRCYVHWRDEQGRLFADIVIL